MPQLGPLKAQPPCHIPPVLVLVCEAWFPALCAHEWGWRVASSVPLTIPGPTQTRPGVSATGLNECGPCFDDLTGDAQARCPGLPAASPREGWKAIPYKSPSSESSPLHCRFLAASGVQAGPCTAMRVGNVDAEWGPRQNPVLAERSSSPFFGQQCQRRAVSLSLMQVLGRKAVKGEHRRSASPSLNPMLSGRPGHLLQLPAASGLSVPGTLSHSLTLAGAGSGTPIPLGLCSRYSRCLGSLVSFRMQLKHHLL